jgi:hypothetical protein
VFVSLNGYRKDEFKTYLYESNDYGKTWKSINGDLPESVANVIIQDPVNADLLYAGLDHGTYVSLDHGISWHHFNKMLNVASYDMLVHPRENELVVGTHGRSVFIADIKPLQQVKDFRKPIMAFEAENIRFNERWGQKQFNWAKEYTPSVSLLYYVGKSTAEVKVEVYDEKNALVRSLIANGTSGFHSLSWDVKINEQAPLPAKEKTKSAPAAKALRYAGKGKYKFRFINGAESSETVVEIK